ncbi:MAG: hypothetical protein NT019_01465 [Candidatus Adlerbacteria bacterium]|nr:hypothetical protein [Candidatus Adlerbacteria bacterium]
MYSDTERVGKLLIGKVKIPVNPLSRNTMYQHSQKEMVEALQHAGLEVEKIETLGKISRDPNTRLFVAIFGSKK